MIIKTIDLTGPALDWAAAKAEGFTPNQAWTHGKVALWKGRAYKYSPSTDWSQGGPIIEREDIGLRRGYSDDGGFDGWVAQVWTQNTVFEDGPTPLIAAMRCYVASKLGDEIDVPDELI
jgi:hypothetical protein